MKTLAYIACLPFILIYWSIIFGIWIVVSPAVLVWAICLTIESVWDYAHTGVWFNPFRDVF